MKVKNEKRMDIIRQLTIGVSLLETGEQIEEEEIARNEMKETKEKIENILNMFIENDERLEKIKEKEINDLFNIIEMMKKDMLKI